MKMHSFPACCAFKFSFHGNRSGEAAWREPGEISAWPPSPLGCQLRHPNCQAFTEVFAIVIYAWNRSGGSLWVPFSKLGHLQAELLSFHCLSNRTQACPNLKMSLLLETSIPPLFSFLKVVAGVI